MRGPRRSVIGPLLCAVLAGVSFATHVSGDPGPGNPHTECATCHSEVAPGGGALDKDLCVGCHLEMQILNPEAQSYGATRRSFEGHLSIDGSSRAAAAPGGGPEISEFGCLTCHEPHRNGRPHQLRDLEQASASESTELDDVSRFCLSCHVDFGKFRAAGLHYTRHPVGVTVSQGDRRDVMPFPALLVDVRDTEERDDDVVSCLSCHEVHQSRHPYLLRWSVEEQGQACSGCHRFDDRRSRPRLTASLR